MAKDDLNPRSGPIQPTSYREGPQGVSPAGQAIIRAYSNVIQQFVARNRDQVHLSTLDQHRVKYTSQYIDIEYSYQFGHERVTVTPYPEPEQPDQPVQYDTPEYGPTTYTFPPIPEEDYDTDCMLVLYKTNQVAAVPMGSVMRNGEVGAIYTGTAAGSSFSGQVPTSQVTIGDTSIIHTDVDLSGRGLGKSILCTPLIIDAVSLGKQVVPLFNGSGSSAGNVSVYTGAAYVTYNNGKFNVGAAPGITQYQPCAITTGGVLYFAPQLTLDQSQIDTDASTLDTDAANAAINDAANKVNEWVSIYTAGWIYSNDYHGVVSWNASSSTTTTLKNNVEFIDIAGVGTDVSQSNSDLELYAVSMVIPQPPVEGQPPATLNQALVTVPLGTAYYGLAQYSAPKMSLSDIQLAYAPTKYYSFDISNTLFHYITPDGGSNDQITTQFPRMTFDPTNPGTWTVSSDLVTGTATQTQTLIYPPGTGVTRTFEWGGALYNGITQTNNPPVPWPPVPPDQYIPNGHPQAIIHTTNYPFSTNYGFVQAGNDTTDQIVLHTPNNPPGISGNGTYEQIKQAQAIIKGILNTPTCNPNGGPGPTLSGSGYITTYQSRTQNTTLPGSPTTRTGPTNDSGGNIPTPPGYDAAILGTKVNDTIAWLSETITGSSDDQTGNDSASRIDVCIFPPGTTQTPYYLRKIQPLGLDETIDIVTPYKTFSNSDGNFKGWLHVANATNVLQGFVVDNVPHLYFDAVDMMPALTKSLNCQPTDIAACYFDVKLSAIKLLAKIR